MTSHLRLVPKTLSPHSPSPTELHRSVVFTDIVDSTALIERLGDDGLLTVIVQHHELAVLLGAELGATQVSSTGDGVFAAFADAEAAVQFARRMVAGMRHAADRGHCPQIRLHVGIATGPVHAWNGDLFGRTMHRAARICKEARPNEVLGDAETAASLVDSELIDGGRQVELRGFAAPETTHEFGATCPAMSSSVSPAVSPAGRAGRPSIAAVG